MSQKTVIIGIDGVPYRLMEDLSNKGVMLNFKSLRNEGVFREMRASLPHISSVSWSSIITGKNPGEHGIFGFTEIIPGTYTLSFPDFNCLKSPAFWHLPEWQGKRYVILNIPSTYPVQELNGVHISGFISLDLEGAVFPQQYIPELQNMGYEIDVDSGIAHQSKSLFLEKLNKVNEARIKAYQYFWARENWDVFCLVFTGSDRLQHFFWDAYETGGHQYHQDFLNYFRRVDEVIGEIADKLDKDDALLILSDHGMERVKTNFNVNYFLQEKGFLRLDKNGQRGYNQILLHSKAFALDPGRIYLNRAGRYPRGDVGKDEEEKVIEELLAAFRAAERDGEKIVKEIFRKEEVYSGKETERAPDLVLVENPGFRLRGSIEKESLFEDDIFTGKHTLEDAFLFVRAKNSEEFTPGNPTVEDVVPLLNKINSIN